MPRQATPIKAASECEKCIFFLSKSIVVRFCYNKIVSIAVRVADAATGWCHSRVLGSPAGKPGQLVENSATLREVTIE